VPSSGSVVATTLKPYSPAATLHEDGPAGAEDRRGGPAVQIRRRQTTMGPGLSFKHFLEYCLVRMRNLLILLVGHLDDH